MKRLMEKIVFCGLVTACRLATVPTRRSPEAANATTEGVVRPPSAFSITVGSPPSSTAMQLFVVPRSMPIVLPIVFVLLLLACKNLSPSVADLKAAQQPCQTLIIGAYAEAISAASRQLLRTISRLTATLAPCVGEWMGSSRN